MQDFRVKETDTQLEVSKHHRELRCGKPYSMKIGCTVWRKIETIHPTIWSRKVKIN